MDTLEKRRPGRPRKPRPYNPGSTTMWLPQDLLDQIDAIVKATGMYKYEIILGLIALGARRGKLADPFGTLARAGAHLKRRLDILAASEAEASSDEG